MKLSYTTMATPELKGVDAIRLAAHYGYQGVDLRVSSDRGELTLEASGEEINTLKNVFKEEGILPASLLCYNKNGGIEPGSWNVMEESLLRHLELANQLDCPVIRIFAGNVRKSGDPEDYLKRTAEVICSALRKDRTTVTILIQNHRGHTWALETVKLIEMVKHPRLGLVFSPEHCVNEDREENLQEILRVVKPFTRQLYIADKKKAETGYIDVLPGRGEVPLREVYNSLGGKEFTGWVTFKWEKVWRRDLAGYETALPYFIDYITEVYKGV